MGSTDPASPLCGPPLEAYVTRLALNPRRWVQRRVERLLFVDAETLRRHMSVDFIPIPSDAIEKEQLIWVPVLLAADRDLRALDLKNAEGISIPLMTDAEAANLIAAGLSRHLVGWLPPDISHDAISIADEVIHDIVIGTGDRAIELADRELGTQGRLARLIKATGSREPKGLGKPERDDLAALIRELGRGRLLLAQVPYKPGERQLLKLSYDAALETGRTKDTLGRLTFLANQAASAFGLTGRRERFDGLVVGRAASYHVEVIPPPDTYVTEVDWHDRPSRGSYVVDDHPYRPHVRAWSYRSEDKARLSLVLHARREALLAPLLFSSLVIALTLGVIPRRLVAGATVDAQTVAALLLVPFALSAYYVRASEHEYVTRMLRGVRIAAVVPVIAALIVTAMLALDQLDPARSDAAARGLPLDVPCASARASMLAVALLVVAMAAPGAGTRSRDLRRRPMRVLALASLLAAATATSLLRLAVGLELLTSMLIAAAAVASAWVLALRHSANIRKLPKGVREATIAVLLAAELAVALAGGWLAHSALSGGSC